MEFSVAHSFLVFVHVTIILTLLVVVLDFDQHSAELRLEWACIPARFGIFK